MSGAVRLGDLCTGHGCYPPRPNVQASSNVIINAKGAHRVGDAWAPHGCGVCVPHSSTQASGSPTVIVNGKALARISDSVACGSSNMEGSSNVIIDEMDLGDPNCYKGPPSYGSISKAYKDTPEPYYFENIQPKLTTEEVPEYHPTNSEQVEKSIDNTPIEYPLSKTPECSLITWKNPIEVANELMNLGQDAWKEYGSNPNIKALWDEIGYDGNRFADETAWCAVFVSAVLKRSGNKYIKTASSQAYKNYGIEVPSLNEAIPGDIVVFYRKGENSGYGHVGFYAGIHNEIEVAVLGGNQSNNLNIRKFKLSNPSKGWGVRSIRRAVSCKDGTPVVEVPFSTDNNVGSGGSVT